MTLTRERWLCVCWVTWRHHLRLQLGSCLPLLSPLSFSFLSHALSEIPNLEAVRSVSALLHLLYKSPEVRRYYPVLWVTADKITVPLGKLPRCPSPGGQPFLFTLDPHYISTGGKLVNPLSALPPALVQQCWCVCVCACVRARAQNIIQRQHCLCPWRTYKLTEVDKVATGKSRNERIRKHTATTVGVSNN